MAPIWDQDDVELMTVYKYVHFEEGRRELIENKSELTLMRSYSSIELWP